MATPGRVTRSTRASSTIDAQSTISSPDPLNTSFDSVAQPSARVTRSAARALSSTAKSVPARSSSPRKQTFALDVGSTKKPSRLFVTVEAEGSEILEGDNNGEDFKDAKRVLFPTPTPKRKRADTTTTSVPLRDEDTPAARTPGRRGRPRRQQTPMKQVPAARKRAKLSADAEEAAAATPAVKATPGRKRKAPFVPEETITWASPSPPKRLRETPSPSLDDEAPAGGSPASSGFFNEPAEDTVAQEDFSPIFAHSLGSLRASLREQETQEIGEATSLIIEGALEELRQSRGEVVESTEQEDELLEDVKEPEVTNHHGDEQREEDEQPEEIDLIEEVEQPEEVEQIEQIDQSEHVDQPQSVDQRDQAEPVDSVDHTEQTDHTEEIDRTEQIDQTEQDDQPQLIDQPETVDQSEQDDQTEQIEQTEQDDQPQHIDQPDDSPEPAAHFNEHDDSPEPVDHSDEVELPEQIIQPDESTGETDEAEETSAPRSFGLNHADFSSSVATKRRSSPRAAVSQPDESTGETNEAEESSAPKTFGLNYADFSSSVATKRRSSPRAPVSPFRDDDGSDYEDSFSEIPQEILDAAAPRGNWPGEARLRGSPTPVLAPPRAPSVDLGTRPSLSPIVRAGRALQSVTSDDASPRSHKNHLGSPFKPAAASTPAQKPGQAPEQQTEDRPQSAASKKSWISDIIDAGVNWFSPTRATSHASADSLSVGQDAGDASPSLPPTRPAPTEASVFKPQSRVAARKARQATVEDEDEEDIWALEALRDSNFQVRPTPQQQSSKTTSETNNRPSFFQSYTGPSRKQSIGSKLGSEDKPTIGSKLGSENKRTFANRSSASKRSMAGSSWKPSTIPMSSDPAAPLESELSEYSLIAGGKQLASVKRSATQQGNEGSAKRRKDMSDFFSSPALLPGAENAQSALERKRLELAPKAAVKSTPQEWSLPTTTFFPTDRPFVKPVVDSPAPAAPALIPALVPQTRETPKPSPQEFDTAERKRAIRQARFAFRRALSETREEHNTSGAQGDLPPFGVDLTRVQFPQAFKFPRDIDTDVIMTREEVSKWAQETSNVESSSPIRHQPNRHASPTKSCLRPSTKPRTPGPRLQWGSDVLSPSGKLLKLAEDQLKQNFITDFKGAMYNERLHAQFGQSKEQFQAILANKENEKEKDFIPLPATPTRDVDMMDVDSFVVPANRNMEAVISISPTKAPSTIIEHDTVVDQNDSVSPASISTVESAETVEAPAPKWGYDDWCYLEDLFQLRKKGPFPFDFPDNFEPRSRHLVGLTMTSHGEKMRVNPWHISIIDGFQANTGRKWSDQEIARRVMSLAIVDLLRKEKREPKKPYRHTRKAAHRAQAAST